MKTKKPNAVLVWKQLEEDLVPHLGLNLIERAVYACLLRHSRFEGKRQLRFGILWLARIVRVSDQPTRHAVRSLAAKGALRLIDRTQAGHLVEVFLPDEIRAAPHQSPLPSCLGRRPGSSNPSSHDIEEMDFSEAFVRREAIHARDGGRCFYCLRRFLIRGRVLDHVVPQARGGTNSYRNLVSCCVECNSQKGESGAEDFLRTLYRQRRITSAELESRLRALEALAAGELRPILGPPAAVSQIVGAGLAPPGIKLKKPEDPRNRKALPLLPKLARRKKGRRPLFSKIPKSDRKVKTQNPHTETRRGMVPKDDFQDFIKS